MTSDRFLFRQALLLTFTLFSLSACSSNPVFGLFGGDDENTEGEAPDEEDRISILALNEELTADPRYAGATIDVPPSYVNTSWTQPGGEADHTLHHLGAALTFETVWKADVGEASESRERLTSPPIVIEDRVFVIDAATRVSSFNAETGDLNWRTELAPDIKERFRLRDLFRGPDPAQIGFGGGVAFDQGRLFVTSGFGFVAALDAISGEELWRVQTDSPVRTPPTAYRGKVYFSTITNEFNALEQETGEKAWTFQSFEESARFLSSASPAAAGDLVVAPFSSGELVAFITDNGRSVWDTTLVRQSRLTALSTLNDIAGSPVIDRGLVYVVSHGGRFSAIDIRSGQPVWENRLASLQMPWVAGDFIFLVSIDSELVCVSRNDGAIVWVSQLQQFKNEKKRKGRISWAGPVLAGDHLVLVSTEGDIVKVSPQNGEVVASEEIDDGSVVAPVVAGEKLFVLTQEGKLIAMR
ncbi:PQQ-binding-like beta-propeller repeat protein [Hyphococcus flavus]|uniref:PQQ-binding-like beta-propeller repeat protein n=1 Tax=Hyphococcus flavus TaxID=1866326 RepID=A0AAE9ZBY4_9PROT|nr:PQQ-binding-like beta-propeller repeat protein [Hyphococcus flavus]WDI31486.1 PQQ-binding-like beta-propeller repeat protein [Hyphococcus flavus]